MSLRYNQLSGSIPPQLGSLANLKYLYLSSNQLTGSIPPELGSLANLVELLLDYNQLSGSLPPELGNLTRLSYLMLINNQLSGSLPPEFGRMASLRTLLLYNNQLSGSIPAELGNLPDLYTLDLHNNQLSGSIPAELGSIRVLLSIQLHGNHLSGSIPPQLGSLGNLNNLILNDNQLSGSIPVELGNLQRLTVLHLHNNQLNGNIPAELGKFTLLRSLRLEGNALVGEIPADLVNLEPEVPEPPDRPRSFALSLGYNRLFASDPTLIHFLNVRAPGWEQTQTVAPADLQAVALSTTAAHLTWTPTPYTIDGGYYEISASTSATGTFSILGLTGSKSDDQYDLTGLIPGATYWIRMRSYTPAHANNQSDLWSGYSPDVSITLLPVAPSANFNTQPVAGVAPLLVDFTNTSTGAYTASQWSFGDGETSIVPNPQHCYTIPGTYTVTLTVSGPGGNSTLTRTSYVTAYEPTQAGFTAQTTSGMGPLDVSFTNTSAGNFTDSQWDFGDGGSSTAANPQHTFTTPGTYTVTLTVSGPGGTDMLTRPSYITVNPGTQSQITPTGGGTLVYANTNETVVSVVVPSGAVTQTISLRYTPLYTVTTAPANFAFANVTFDLSAYLGATPLAGFRFEKPVAVTIAYTDDAIQGLNESSLTLFYWNSAAAGGGAWEDAACGPYRRDPAANRFSTSICHLTRFAVFARQEHSVYLPVMVKRP